MMGLNSTELERALCSRTMETGKEKVVTVLNVTQAQYARDALAKNIYSRLFDWIVKRINESIKVRKWTGLIIELSQGPLHLLPLAAL